MKRASEVKQKTFFLFLQVLSFRLKNKPVKVSCGFGFIYLRNA